MIDYMRRASELAECVTDGGPYADVVTECVTALRDVAAEARRETLEEAAAHRHRNPQARRGVEGVNKYGCRPSEDVCLQHDDALVCRHGCELAKAHPCIDYLQHRVSFLEAEKAKLREVLEAFAHVEHVHPRNPPGNCFWCLARRVYEETKP